MSSHNSSSNSIVVKCIRFFIENYDLKCKTIMLAVSGGKDSVTLLDVCNKLKEEYSLKLVVAHFDHNLRDSSKGDADFVENLTLQKYKLKFFRGFAHKEDCIGNVEAWARKARYEFFKQIYSKENIDVIFTAHTGSDALETLCMRLISNKEPRGIYEKDETRHLMRPMLSVLRKDINDYVQENHLQYVEDPTNCDTSYLRNKVRHKLVPFLKENFNENIESFLNIRAVSIEEDLCALYEIAERKLKEISYLEKFSRAWVKAFNDISLTLPNPIKWRMAELSLKDELHFNIGKKTAIEIINLFNNKRTAVNLPQGKRVLRSKGRVFLE